MKISVFKILSLLLACAMILPLLLACGEENPSISSSSIQTDDTQNDENSFAKLSEVEKALYILKSDLDINRMRVDTTATIGYTYSGVAVSAMLSGYTTEIDEESGYILYSEQTVSMAISGYSQVTTITSGYSDGREFERILTDGIGNGYYANITEEEFKSKRKEMLESGPADDFGLTDENCQTITCTQNSHGGWVAVFTDITDDGLAEFRKYIRLSFSEIINVDSLTNARLELCFSENLMPVYMKLDFTFSDSGSSLSMEGTYTLNEDVKTPKIDLTGYVLKPSLDSDTPVSGM